MTSLANKEYQTAPILRMMSSFIKKQIDDDSHCLELFLITAAMF
jgi:hypothetical protein